VRLNPAKSAVLQIYRGYWLSPIPILFIGFNSIPYIYHVKNLGVTFNFDLSCKVYCAITGLRNLALLMCDLLLPSWFLFQLLRLCILCSALVNGMSTEGSWSHVLCFWWNFRMLFADLHGILIGMLHVFAGDRGRFFYFLN
jgi:hypothetical protein